MELFKVQIKYNWKAWLSLTAICVFYVVMFIAIGQLMKNVGDMQNHGIAAMLANPLPLLGQFFTTMFGILALIFSIMFVGKAYNKPVETTSLSCYLSLPLSRTKYALTMIINYAMWMLAMGLIIYIAGVITFVAAGINVDYGAFANMTLAAVLQSATIGFITIFIASAFAGGKWTKALTIAVPIVLFVLPMFSALADWLDWLKYLTPYGWVNITDVATNSVNLLWLWDIVYVAIIGVATALSAILFKKRQLSI